MIHDWTFSAVLKGFGAPASRVLVNGNYQTVIRCDPEYGWADVVIERDYAQMTMQTRRVYGAVRVEPIGSPWPKLTPPEIKRGDRVTARINRPKAPFFNGQSGFVLYAKSGRVIVRLDDGPTVSGQAVDFRRDVLFL